MWKLLNMYKWDNFDETVDRIVIETWTPNKELKDDIKGYIKDYFNEQKHLPYLPDKSN
jgi:hypothetical protein